MSKKLKPKAPIVPKSNARSIILLTILSYLAGYLMHNSLNTLYMVRGAARVNNCLSTTADIFLCMPYYEPQGWEKLVRF